MITTAVPEYCAKCGQQLGSACTIRDGLKYHPMCQAWIGPSPPMTAPVPSDIDGPAGEAGDLIAWLNKASKAIYLATDGPVADEISPKLLEAAARLAALTGKSARVFANPCIQKLGPDEPFFVLLGRDKHAAEATRAWADFREAERGVSPKTTEAREIAAAMEAFAALTRKEG